MVTEEFVTLNICSIPEMKYNAHRKRSGLLQSSITQRYDNTEINKERKEKGCRYFGWVHLTQDEGLPEWILTSQGLALWNSVLFLSSLISLSLTKLKYWLLLHTQEKEIPSCSDGNKFLNHTTVHPCHKCNNAGVVTGKYFIYLLCNFKLIIQISYKRNKIYEGWNFNSGNYLFTTDTK